MSPSLQKSLPRLFGALLLALLALAAWQWRNGPPVQASMLTLLPKGAGDALVQQADLTAATALLNGPGDEQFRAMKETVAQLIAHNQQDAIAASAEGDRLYANALYLIWSLIGVSLLLVAFCAWGLGNLIRTPLQRLLQQAELVANGDCNKIIASKLNIADRTVKAHLSVIFQKLKVNDRLQLALLANKSFDHKNRAGL